MRTIALYALCPSFVPKSFYVTVSHHPRRQTACALLKIARSLLCVNPSVLAFWDTCEGMLSASLPAVFVHEDGAGLETLPKLFGERKIEASIDAVFSLDDVNAAMAKVAAGGSKGKTVLTM